jgi:hypothetical protein
MQYYTYLFSLLISLALSVLLHFQFLIVVDGLLSRLYGQKVTFYNGKSQRNNQESHFSMYLENQSIVNIIDKCLLFFYLFPYKIDPKNNL